VALRPVAPAKGSEPAVSSGLEHKGHVALAVDGVDGSLEVEEEVWEEAPVRFTGAEEKGSGWSTSSGAGPSKGASSLARSAALASAASM
jgi:hypothetical protein